jgi:3-oxoacyl-[acyl-carrier protein] reductase
MSETPVAFQAEELAVGQFAEFERELSEDDVLTFARLSGDWNPLHVDAEYARGTSYDGRIAHGALQVGLASALIGMHLPGKHVLLGSIQARFVAPLYFPCRVAVRGELTAWNVAARSGTVKVVVRDAARQVPTAEIFMRVTLHDERGAADVVPATAAAIRPLAATAARPVVVVTGAAGGLGAAIATELAAAHVVVAIVHRTPLAPEVRALPDVHELAVDLAAPDLAQQMAALLGTRPLWGIVHAAWPGLPRGGLLDAPDEAIEEQVRFGSLHTVRLARVLFAHAGADGGRLVVVSSLAGGRRPTLAMAPYSLGKATLESTIRLLAPEMARKRIAVNAICPSLVPVGMNRHQSERALKLQAASVPLGRLCDPGDVAGLVRFLLSRDAAFVSGQLIELAGGLV